MWSLSLVLINASSASLERQSEDKGKTNSLKVKPNISNWSKQSKH